MVNFDINSQIKIYIGDEVLLKLTDINFKNKWDKLYNLCPWGTVFQSFDFVSTWYNLYYNIYIPIVIIGENNNELFGLFALTKHSKNNTITGAGADQGEYQTWLAKPSQNEYFTRGIFTKLLIDFPDHKIYLKYLPSNTPVNFFIQDSVWKNKSLIIPSTRPLIKITKTDNSIFKSSKDFRNKLNQMKRIGDVKFEEITDINDTICILDLLIDQFEFRKAALLNLYPFTNDSLRKQFIIDLFKKKLLQIAVLKLNNEIVASTIITRGKDCIHFIGIFTYSPLYATLSPGKVHLNLLINYYLQRNIILFDLSPGDDSYKYTMANDFDTVYMFQISNSILSNRIKLVKHKIKTFFKAVMQSRNINYKKIKWRVLKLKNKLVNGNIHHFIFTNDYNELIIPCSSFKDKKLNLLLNKNSLQDLLKFDQHGSRITRWEFLERAEERFKNGQQAYSFTKNNSLVCCAWVIDRGTNNNTLQIDELYCHPNHLTHLSDFLSAFANDQSINQKVESLTVQIPYYANYLLKPLKCLNLTSNIV